MSDPHWITLGRTIEPDLDQHKRERLKSLDDGAGAICHTIADEIRYHHATLIEISTTHPIRLCRFLRLPGEFTAMPF